MSAPLPLPACNPASLTRNSPSFATENVPRSRARNCFSGTGPRLPAAAASSASRLGFGGTRAPRCSRRLSLRGAARGEKRRRARSSAAQPRVREGGKPRDGKQPPPPRLSPARRPAYPTEAEREGAAGSARTPPSPSPHAEPVCSRAAPRPSHSLPEGGLRFSARRAVRENAASPPSGRSRGGAGRVARNRAGDAGEPGARTGVRLCAAQRSQVRGTVPAAAGLSARVCVHPCVHVPAPICTRRAIGVGRGLQRSSSPTPCHSMFPNDRACTRVRARVLPFVHPCVQVHSCVIRACTHA